jgi:hypothetical protein
MFGLTFFVVILTYNLRLSGLYVNTADNYTSSIVFIISLLSVIVGFLFQPFLNSNIRTKNITLNKNAHKKNKSFAMAILLVGFGLECLNNGGVPLFMVLRGQLYDYTQFGIKTFHVFYMGYLSACAIVNMERFLTYNDKRYLQTPIVAVLITILILNRGATFLIIFPMALMYISSIKKFKSRYFYLSFIAVIACIIMFGVLGDKRMSASGYNDPKAIYNIGLAAPLFEELPSGFFWTYLYATSPFANLVYQERALNISKGGVEDFIAGSIYPDFISKYTNPEILNDYEMVKLTPELNVGTGFSMALMIFGYTGVLFLFIWFLIFCMSFIIVNRFNYFISTCSTLTSVAIFMCFNNMLIFSSCVLQLIFIVFLTRFRCGARVVI